MAATVDGTAVAVVLGEESVKVGLRVLGVDDQEVHSLKSEYTVLLVADD